MSATFSINLGHVTETSRKLDIYSVIQNIPDNTSKLISPRDVRDAFLTIWSDSPFKYTSGTSSIRYIGIDSGNPSNRDIKQKILIGKRSLGNGDIMNNSLLTSLNAADIFLYNTKPDSADQSYTKISILAGTNSAIFPNAPYIQSSVNGNIMNFDLVNPSGGPINLTSNTGRVFINGIAFPTVAETATASLNGKILRYFGNFPNGVLRWVEPSFTLTNIGREGFPTNIMGSPVLLNGHSLEFVDDTPMPSKVGDFEIGSTFSENSFNNQNWPIVEVIRKILYPYIPPILSISSKNFSTNNNFVELGIASNVILTYSVIRVSNNIINYNLSDTNINSSISGLPYKTISATVSVSVSSSIPLSSKIWTLNVTDSENLSYSATTSVTFVNPIYYGFTNAIIGPNGISVDDFIQQQNPTKLVFLPDDKLTLSITGSGYLYFIQPSNFRELVFIRQTDIQGTNEFSNFYSIGNTTSSETFITYLENSPIGQYRIYRSRIPCGYNGVGKFEFIYQ
jgi:hypothetical protein